ncbi:DUF4132 domain-containing protein [Actinomadura viridis]|uniref:DUF4132 domain-containing protein n=1 Tax=Actinomadura viridis TaxID=58110 RepID=UPI0036998A27
MRLSHDAAEAPSGHEGDALVLPDPWLRELHPRRGGLSVPRLDIDEALAGTARTAIERYSEVVDAMLGAPATEPEIAARARAHLGGTPDPLGAAAVAAGIAATAWLDDDERLPAFVELWLAEHGPAFAAIAFIEVGRVDVGLPYSVRRAIARSLGRRSRSQNPAGPPQSAVRSALSAAKEKLGTGVPLSFTDNLRGSHRRWVEVALLRRLRTFLAHADDREYEEAVKRLEERRRTPYQMAIAAYLVPTRPDWLDQCCASQELLDDGTMERFLLCSASDRGHLDLLGKPKHRWGWDAGWQPDVIGTLLDALGAETVPFLNRILDEHSPESGGWKTAVEALSLIPADEAFQAMVDRLGHRQVRARVVEAAGRRPGQAVRFLSPVAAGTSPAADFAGTVLTGLLVSDPALLDTVPAEVRTALTPVLASLERIEEASPGDLPALLADPPWARPRSRRKPLVIEGLAVPADRRLVWEPGERDRWAESECWYAGAYPWPPESEANHDWEGDARLYREGELETSRMVGLLLKGADELVRPLLAEWNTDDVWLAEQWLPRMIARFGLDAHPIALRVATHVPAAHGGVLLPFLDAEVAQVMADWLARLKTGRRHARAWFARYGLAAVPLLLPAALGGPGKERRAAEGALLHLAAAHGPEPIVEAAGAYGDEAAAEIATLLATDPLEVLPARMPKIPAWADTAMLPQPLLRGRDRALPAAATGHVLTILAMCKPGEPPYPGLEVVREACDPGSLAAFGWAVFQRWLASGAPGKDGWALTQLGLIGDDDTVRRLTPLIKAWPGESGSARAAAGLDVLAAIGSDVALLHLHGIARTMKFKGLRARAQEKIDEIAAALELTTDQLADRAVPDFGLDTEGGMVLDYGPRRFRVGFDEQLRPYVVQEDGKIRKDLPRPAAGDDAALAPAAKRRFTDLKKEVRAIADREIRRLERAMTTGRSRSLEEFRTYLVGHGLMWHIARRLVWLAEEEGRVTAFRLSEDRTFADVADDEFTPAETARIGVAHPLRLGDDLGAWSELFADYEILQPFQQLGRPLHVLTEEERASGRLRRFEGAVAPYGKAKGMSQDLWGEGTKGRPADGWIARKVTGGRYVVADLNPGLSVGGYMGDYPEQRLTAVWLADEPGPYREGAEGTLRFGDLDPVDASEVIVELTRMTAADGGS